MTVVPFKNITVLMNSNEASMAFTAAMKPALEAFFAELEARAAIEPGAGRQTIVVTAVMSTDLIAALRAPDAFTIMSRPATPSDTEAEE